MSKNSYNKNKKNSTSRNGDWICQYCRNYNYSFRSICNRCSAPPLPIHQLNTCRVQNTILRKQKEKDTIKMKSTVDENFPKVVFLMLGDENVDWDQYQVGVRINRTDHTMSTSWIQKLIED